LVVDRFSMFWKVYVLYGSKQTYLISQNDSMSQKANETKNLKVFSTKHSKGANKFKLVLKIKIWILKKYVYFLQAYRSKCMKNPIA